MKPIKSTFKHKNVSKAIHSREMKEGHGSIDAVLKSMKDEQDYLNTRVSFSPGSFFYFEDINNRWPVQDPYQLAEIMQDMINKKSRKYTIHIRPSTAKQHDKIWSAAINIKPGREREVGLTDI
jgi:hypothetical protein